jgi:hypothetical protein
VNAPGYIPGTGLGDVARCFEVGLLSRPYPPLTTRRGFDHSGTASAQARISPGPIESLGILRPPSGDCAASAAAGVANRFVIGTPALERALHVMGEYAQAQCDQFALHQGLLDLA